MASDVGGRATKIHRQGNLPVALTTFVGRRREVAEVRRALTGSRLVTLTGVGGVGKTRLAIQVATDVRRLFADGVWLVELAHVADPALVHRVVAATIGVRDESARDPSDLLSDRLADQQTLIVLDNCEHVLEACAVLADDVLRSAPNVRFLATSRQALGLPAEQVVAVPPLSVPGESVASPEAIIGFEAVHLLLERAGRVVPTFSLTEANGAAVADLCRRLDGLPLAIELAAARLRVLSPRQVVDRLDERYGLLTSGSPAAQPRQRSLQALVDWSFERCSVDERTLWARASVFAGAFDLEAAEQVCSGDELPAASVLDAVAGLIDKSVLLRTEDGDQVRYRMLESIREYGRMRLGEAGETARWQRRHLAYCESLAGQAAGEWFGPDEPAWRGRARAGLPDLRAALEFCLADPGDVDADAGLRLAAQLWYGWRALGILGEGRRWLDRLLQVAPDDTRTTAQALWADAALAIFQDDVESARPRVERAGALGRELGDDVVLAYVALFSGQVAMGDGDMARGRGLLQSALAAHRATGDALGTAMTLFRLSLTHAALGDIDRAVEAADAHLALAEKHGAEWAKALAHWALGVALWQRGAVKAADRHATEVVTGAWAHNDPIGTGRGMELLAWAAAASHRPERAARLLGAVDSIRRQVGGHSFGYPHLADQNEACAASAVAALSQDRFDAFYEAGLTAPLADGVAFAVGGRPAPAAPAAPEESAAPLTPREQEVAQLVGKGMTNQQIADTLIISRRTAETHVDHILSKLGFTSRAQVAAWVTEHRLG